MSFDANGVICVDIHKAWLGLVDENEIKKTAVCELSSATMFDGSVPHVGGLHDRRLGPLDAGDTCATCGKRDECPGHVGFLQLGLPVYHPLFVNQLIKILKCCCLRCCRLKIDSSTAAVYLQRFQIIQLGDIGLLQRFESICSTNEKQLSSDETKAAKRAALIDIINEIKDIKERTCTNGQSKSIGSSISANTAVVELWRRTVSEILTKYERAVCPYCGVKRDVTIRKADLESRIELQWSFNQGSPVDVTVLLKLLDGESETNRTGCSELGTINDFEEYLTADEDAAKVPYEFLGRHGKRLAKVDLLAYQIEPIMRRLFDSADRSVLNYLFPVSENLGAAAFFMNVIPVPSNKFRPLAKSNSGVGAGILHPRTAGLLEILRSNANLYVSLVSLRHNSPDGIFAASNPLLSSATIYGLNLKNSESCQKTFDEHRRNYELLYNYAFKLQEVVNGYVDSTKSKDRNGPPAIRQWMEKKSGAVRQKMMGKRVNYAARTTLAPDCQINTNEIGIPLPFAMQLTIPVNANEHNVEQLCQLIQNGSTVYPGCNAIRDPHGRKLDFKRRPLNDAQKETQCHLLRNHVDKITTATGFKPIRPYIVYRHLRDGDVVLMNRQPTLHKASMMAHFIRVLPNQKAFRLHYSNCGSYNADFDGDEMNMHCLQDYSSRAEASSIMNADCTYTAPKSGEPIRGIIQDHVLGGNFLTVRDTFLTKDQYMELIYVGVYSFVDKHARIDVRSGTVIQNELSPGDPFSRLLGQKNLRIVTAPPTILKPQALYTGKQVITAILKTLIDNVTLTQYSLTKDGKKNIDFEKNYAGINLSGKAKTPGDAWNGILDGDREESSMVIQDSELLQGVFDKAQIGASTYGLVHFCYEMFNPRVAGMLLSCFSRVFTSYLQIRGFSCAAGDFQMSRRGEIARKELITRVTAVGTVLQEQFIDSIYSSMGWTENIKDNSAFEQEHKLITKRLGKLFNSTAMGGAALNANVIGEATEVLKRLDANTDEISRFSGSSYVATSANEQWSVSRALRANALGSDWRCLSGPEVAAVLQGIIDELYQLGTSNEIVQSYIYEQFLTTPELCDWFPTVADLFCIRGHKKCQGAQGLEYADSAKKAKFLASSQPLTPQFAHLSPTGSTIVGYGLNKTIKTHYPSWAWSENDTPFGFESPLRYVTRILGLQLFAEGSAVGKRSFMMAPSELTRLRMERLVSDHFSGKESLFITMFDKFFQSNMGGISSQNNDLVSGDVTLFPFPINGFSSMVTTGAKGSKINFAMICGMLSQQSLEGRRVPVMVSGKTLPTFARWDLGTRAGGLITDRYLTGLRPAEYYFHCMAGREGLIDTAVKTATSGYLQRCVIKSLEGMNVQYDGTVRDGDGSIIQFLYGEDGVDVSRIAYLHNVSGLLANPVLVQQKFADEVTLSHPTVTSSFSKVEEIERERAEIIANNNMREPSDRVEVPVITGRLCPVTNPGVISENYERNVIAELKTISASDPVARGLVNAGLCGKKDFSKGRVWTDKKSRPTKISKILRIKYSQSLVPPGEAVGCLAAQSMGEPATQMTLNTFHLAGHGAANVTLGIPRLREILQTAGYASTPLSYIPMIGPSATAAARQGQDTLLGFTKIALSDIVHSVGVETNLYVKPSASGQENVLDRYWGYEFHLQLENLDHFCSVVPKYTPQKLINFIINRTVKDIMKTVNKLTGIYAVKTAEETFDRFDDELQLVANAMIFNRGVRTLDRKARLKEKYRSAGLAGTAGAQGENINSLTDVELASGFKRSSLADDPAMEDQTNETENEVTGSNEFDDAKYDSDFSADDSEADLTDVEAEALSDNDEGETVCAEISDGNTSDGELEQVIPAEKRHKGNKNLGECNMIELPALQCEVEGPSFKPRNMPAEVYRFLDCILICRKTWRLVIKCSIPYAKVPREMNFTNSIVNIIKKQMIQSISGLDNPHFVAGSDVVCTLEDKTKVQAEIQCSGSNLKWIWKLDCDAVNHSRLYTNDIRAIYDNYGIEACRQAIVRELASVFAVYGISVDYRHLSLIADAMTSSGEFRAFSRLGMSNHSSPLLQMSFETSFKFLSDGVARNATDNLKCPAGSIVVGRQPFVGTGMCDMLTIISASK